MRLKVTRREYYGSHLKMYLAIWNVPDSLRWLLLEQKGSKLLNKCFGMFHIGVTCENSRNQPLVLDRIMNVSSLTCAAIHNLTCTVVDSFNSEDSIAGAKVKFATTELYFLLHGWELGKFQENVRTFYFYFICIDYFWQLLFPMTCQFCNTVQQDTSF